MNRYYNPYASSYGGIRENFRESVGCVPCENGVKKYATDKTAGYTKENEAEACTFTAFPENPVQAMAYVPFQLSLKLFSCDEGIMKGTLFSELYKPLTGCCE